MARRCRCRPADRPRCAAVVGGNQILGGADRRLGDEAARQCHRPHGGRGRAGRGARQAVALRARALVRTALRRTDFLRPAARCLRCDGVGAAGAAAAAGGSAGRPVRVGDRLCGAQHAARAQQSAARDRAGTPADHAFPAGRPRGQAARRRPRPRRRGTRDRQLSRRLSALHAARTRQRARKARHRLAGARRFCSRPASDGERGRSLRPGAHRRVGARQRAVPSGDRGAQAAAGAARDRPALRLYRSQARLSIDQLRPCSASSMR